MSIPIAGIRACVAFLGFALLLLACTTERDAPIIIDAPQNMVITWSYRSGTYRGANATFTDFSVDGLVLGIEQTICDFVKANHFRYRQLALQFPKGEPAVVDYHPPYLPLAKFCYDFYIPIAYISSDGKRITAHTLTFVDYDGEIEPDKAQYVFDRINLGLEEQALPQIMQCSIDAPDFIQVLCPWKETPSGLSHDPPRGVRELRKHFLKRGVRVEYYEERVGFNEDHPGSR
ncbi:MAG TPA: hypothetical protein VFI02_17305 [Armatimonadota bacterium]|nr:hypothetical protein [Armatimonadota bacterium]